MDNVAPRQPDIFFIPLVGEIVDMASRFWQYCLVIFESLAQVRGGPNSRG